MSGLCQPPFASVERLDVAEFLDETSSGDCRHDKRQPGGDKVDADQETQRPTGAERPPATMMAASAGSARPLASIQPHAPGITMR